MYRKLIILILILSITAYNSQQDEVTLLRWAGPPGSRPETYREWIQKNPYSEFWVIKDYSTDNIKSGPDVAILTDASLSAPLSEEVNYLISELESKGYSVLSYTLSGGTPDSLKNLLINIYTSDSIEGVLLIGDLPVPWFQVGKDHYTYGYAEWPVDLFYMDLDGTWLDTLKYDSVNDTLISGVDSIFDTHYGNISPEIYVGRLLPTGMGNDTILIENYFRKDSLYWNGFNEMYHEALVYVDDDWIPWSISYANAVAILYNDTMFISDAEVTRAVDYDGRIDSVRAWVSVFAHSWPGGHQFTYNSGNSHDYFYSYEYINQNPPSNFYNHFACSFCRYTTDNYGGGQSIFNQDYGVGSIGSTKTGSMLDFDYFYHPLSEGANLGEAFKKWFEYITQDGITFSELCWHYGMTLLGDPFLKPTGHVYPRISVIIDTLRFEHIQNGNIDTLEAFSVFNNGPENLLIDSIVSMNNWVDSVFPENFSVSSFDSVFVNVRVTKSGLNNGIHHSNLLIYSNDPDINPYTIPVKFEVGVSGLEEIAGIDCLYLRNSPVYTGDESIILKYKLSNQGNVMIRIYDVLGNIIREFDEGLQKPGIYTLTWDTKNKRGSEISTGTYFFSFISGGREITDKVLILR